MKRRGFIVSLSALASARSFLAAAGAERARIGLCSFSCHQHWNAAGAGEKGVEFSDEIGFYHYARELGAEGVQTALRGDNPLSAPILRQMVERDGGYYEGDLRLPKTEGDLAGFESSVRLTRDAGASVARAVLMGGRRYEVFKSPDEFSAFQARSKRSLELAEPVLARHGLRLAVENHKDLTTDELVTLMRDLSSEWVGVLVDTGYNVALLEDPQAVVEALAPFALSVHLKDMAVKPCDDGFLLSEVPPGTGALDLPRLVATLTKSNPSIVFNLEMATRDPLRVPCLTDAYFTTFPGRKAARLEAMMNWVAAHPPKVEPPSVSGKPVAQILSEEEANNRSGLGWMRKHIAVAAVLLGALLPSAPAAAGATEWPFFAMDTAIRDLANLGAAKRLGYEGVGWRFEPSGPLAISVARIRESGLTLIAVYGGATLTKEGVGFKGDLEARFAALAGTGTTLWLPVNSADFVSSDPAGDLVAVPEFRRLADLAAKHGLRVALYPHAGSWIERIQDAVRIAGQVDRPNFGVTFNLCHCLRVGDEAKIPALLAEAAPHLFLVTINGADRDAAGAPWERLIRPLGEGDFDVSGLLAGLEKIGYTGPIGLQAFGVKVPVEENLKRSMESWQELAPSD